VAVESDPVSAGELTSDHRFAANYSTTHHSTAHCSAIFHLVSTPHSRGIHPGSITQSKLPVCPVERLLVV
jgi:hypothetical protein